MITGAAGAVVAVLIISALTKFTDRASVLFEPAVPDGAVVAFMSPCKEVDGWEDYAHGAYQVPTRCRPGRVAASTTTQAAVKPKRDMGIKLGDQGGQEAHKLTYDEMLCTTMTVVRHLVS